MINLNDINEVQFEELCYDLLIKLGFININWRKGTGKTTSIADSGRDIEASLMITDIDNTIYEEKWYIECKHCVNGVSVDKIANAVAWASSEKIDKLLIITSNFLSNSCKQYISGIQENSVFKIKVWENKELESLLNNYIDLLYKYKINNNFSTYEIMNPYHMNYITSLQNNTLNYFFKVLDNIDSQKREDILELTYRFFTKDYGTPINCDSQKIEHKSIYPHFVQSCQKALEITSDIFLVNSIVNITLQILFDKGNVNSIDDTLKSRTEMLENLIMLDVDKNMSKKDLIKKIKSDNASMDLINFFERINKELPERVTKNYELYNYFCNMVVAKLLKEH